MTSLAISAILLSTVFHASWNAIAKNETPSLAFFAFAMSAGALVATPFHIYFHVDLTHLPAQFWLITCFSGIAQTVYLGALARAYSREELSIVYPLVRCLPVIGIPLLTAFLFRTNALSVGSWIGIGLIMLGSIMIPCSSRKRGASLRHLAHAAINIIPIALLAAGATMSYTILDQTALGLMKAHGLSVVDASTNYMFVQAYSTLVWIIPAVLVTANQRRLIPKIWRMQLAKSSLAGVTMLATYGLILTAVSMSKELSHVVALRQLSLPIGFLIGIICFKESKSWSKFLGMFVILSGLATVAYQ